MVSRLDQSASFRIFDSTFYFPHSAIPHFTHNLRVDYMAEVTAPCDDVVVVVVVVFQFSIRNYFSCFCANVRPVRGITSAKNLYNTHIT